MATPTLALAGTAVADPDIESLISVAIRSLHRMQLSDSLFCLERVRGDEAPRGRSLRYSVMTYIGLARADRAGYEHGFDLDELREALWRELDSDGLRPGDYGLFLWAEAVRGSQSDGQDLVARAAVAVAAAGGPERLAGQEIGWLAIGLCRHPAARKTEAGGRLLRSTVDELVGRVDGASGLLAHFGRRHPRSRFANFATEIYGTLALAAAAHVDVRALPVARRVGDALLDLQLRDGGWPWLYDVRRGRVVERYEVYSVHQHAMAPMGLIELAQASGDDRYVDAARRGLAWIHGRNELGIDMVAEDEGLVYRSIRRSRPFDRAILYANTAAAAGLGRGLGLSGFRIELQATCRPYELGWLLEAWCGREELAGAVEPVPAVRGVEGGSPRA